MHFEHGSIMAYAPRSVSGRNMLIARQVRSTLEKLSKRSLAEMTGYSNESVRRYLNGTHRVPADFIRQLCVAFEFDANQMLRVPEPTGNAYPLKQLSTRVLLEELTSRIARIEDCAMGSLLVKLSTHAAVEHKDEEPSFLITD